LPQLDIMTFYIQGWSVLLSLSVSFYYFYQYLLPSISIILFMKSLLRKKFTVDKRILKTNLRKLIIRLSVVNGPVYQSIKNALSLFLAFFFECFRVNKIIYYNNFYRDNLCDIQYLLHQYILD